MIGAWSSGGYFQMIVIPEPAATKPSASQTAVRCNVLRHQTYLSKKQNQKKCLTGSFLGA